eukprot:COSAG06_NODE_16764_length_982_cov_1.106455_2_plen_79_part_01
MPPRPAVVAKIQGLLVTSSGRGRAGSQARRCRTYSRTVTVGTLPCTRQQLAALGWLCCSACVSCAALSAEQPIEMVAAV